jgi:hypothetical protein
MRDPELPPIADVPVERLASETQPAPDPQPFAERRGPSGNSSDSAGRSSGMSITLNADMSPSMNSELGVLLLRRSTIGGQPLRDAGDDLAGLLASMQIPDLRAAIQTRPLPVSVLAADGAGEALQ